MLTYTNLNYHNLTQPNATGPKTIQCGPT